jgi:hypothetical protein
MDRDGRRNHQHGIRLQDEPGQVFSWVAKHAPDLDKPPVQRIGDEENAKDQVDRADAGIQEKVANARRLLAVLHTQDASTDK